MIRQLKWKFVTILMGMVSFILICSLSLSYIFVKQQLETEAMDVLESIASWDSLNQAIPNSWDFNQVALPYFAVEVHYTGQIIALWDEYYHLTENDLLWVIRSILGLEEDSGTLNSLNLRYVKEELSTGIRIVCSDLNFETQILESFFYTCCFIGASALVLLFFLSLSLANLLLRPVEQSWTQQKQFIADASHELKTPLTIILSSAELLSTQLPSEEHSTRWLENITGESHRMQRLIEDMLTLTKFQGVTPTSPQDVIDFSDLVERCVMLFEPVAFERELFLQDDLKQGLYVLGDKDRLQQLLSILLDNSVKYSLPQQQITVKLQTESGKSLLFSVSNASAPFTTLQCQQIFHRFYRQDVSRSKEKGYGLGLSIAQSIVDGNQGKIWASYQDDTFTMWVKLPLAPSP